MGARRRGQPAGAAAVFPFGAEAHRRGAARVPGARHHRHRDCGQAHHPAHRGAGAQAAEQRSQQPIHLEAVRIAEIDELSDAVQSLSQEVADASFRLSGIIEMAGIAIGAFEYDKETRKVYWTGQLFEVLMQDPPPKAVLSADEFERRTEGLKDCCEEISEDGSLCIFRLEKSGNPRWVRLKALEAAIRYIGVTQEMVEKKKIEYDRDYDILTNLYNRRAFHERMKALFAQPEKLRCPP